VAESKSAPRVWRKSSASDSTTCVEVAFVEGLVLVRHSLDPSGPMLTFSHNEWAAFLAGVRKDEFDNDPA
jgi:hypothetical protein